jgi:SsrA-binding protein
MTREDGQRVIATNRKALHNYEVLERAEAGVALRGTEVKAIREGGLSFRDSFVELRGGELWWVGCRIAPYSHGNMENHAEARERKLLLHRREIDKLGGRAVEKGLTLVPLQAYFKGGRVKLQIGLARGKRAYDKREAIRRRDTDRDTQRTLAEARRNR